MTGPVLIIGATGTIGSAVVSELEDSRSIIAAARTSGERIDLADHASIEAAMARIGKDHGPLDGIISCAGGGMIGRVSDYDLDDFLPRLGPKLLGQVALVRHGSRIIRPGGAIVLTSGILESSPQVGMSHLAVINAGLRGFVRNAALEYPELRISVVSPGLVEESPPKVLDLFGDMSRIAAGKLAGVYRHAIEHGESGVVHEAFGD